MKQFLKRLPLVVKLKRWVKPSSCPIDGFLRDFFRAKESKVIIQIGANDGEMCDPLRPFLLSPGNYAATLIEPLPYYAEKLRKLYKSRRDITIVQAAIGEEEGIKPLYFIPPDIANDMNGDGPKNNWAHGQGSFNKETVIHWIHQNGFRGEEYRKKIPLFIDSIASIETRVKLAREFIPDVDNLLVVIDVQGFEMEVLKGINWDHPPSYVLLEDDLGNTSAIMNFMNGKGYTYMCGETDKLYRHSY